VVYQNGREPPPPARTEKRKDMNYTCKSQQQNVMLLTECRRRPIAERHRAAAGFWPPNSPHHPEHGRKPLKGFKTEMGQVLSRVGMDLDLVGMDLGSAPRRLGASAPGAWSFSPPRVGDRRRHRVAALAAIGRQSLGAIFGQLCAPKPLKRWSRRQVCTASLGNQLGPRAKPASFLWRWRAAGSPWA
jgi:hypothetical protein